MKHYTLKVLYKGGGSCITSVMANNFMCAAIKGRQWTKEHKNVPDKLEVCDADCNFFETYSL